MARLACAIAVLVTATAWADPTVVFRSDRGTVQAGVPFQLILEISGSKIGQPTFADVEGLEVQNRPVNSFTSTQVEFAAGSMKTVKRVMFAYLARANKVGKMTIPGVTAEVDGKTVTSEPVIVSVVGNGTAAATAQGNPPSTPGASGTPVGATPPVPQQQPISRPAGRPLSEATWQDVAYTEMAVDKREVYEGECLMLTLSIGKLALPGLHLQSATGKDRGLPTTEGFYTVPPAPGSGGAGATERV